MNNPPKRGWGSLLSGAVAGIESKLDVILADDAEASARSRAADKEKKEKDNPIKPLDTSRPSSRNNRVNDRLKARLAQAVAKNADAAKSRTTSEGPTPRTQSPAAPVSVRPSVDEEQSDPVFEIQPRETVATEGASRQLEAKTEEVANTEESLRPSMDDSSSRKSIDQAQQPPVEPVPIPRTDDTPDTSSLAQTDSSSPTSEMHEYLEKIDALHSKIAYLTTELHANATSTADAAAPASLEKKCAEQDAKIAQLIREGEKLSHDQLKAHNAIKSLRLRIQEQDKAALELRRKSDKADQENRDLREKLRSAENREKRANDRANELFTAEKSLALVSSERDDGLKQIEEMKKQVQDAERRADEAEKNAKSGRAEQHARTIADLQDDLSNARIEKKLLEDRVKSEMIEIKEAYNRQLETSKMSELELRAEVQVSSSRSSSSRMGRDNSDICGAESRSEIGTSPTQERGDLCQQHIRRSDKTFAPS
jgi:hypothetical protein